ncbi:MAG: ABC transporter permease, partial [Clostridia bacterium]|nr:ABC transporter permease [Clostridia bacterium]
ESCVLSVLGGLIGLLFSFAGIGIWNAAAGTSISMNWPVGAAAIVFCAFIGILFGSYPAAKASALQPIDALHAE